MKTSVYKVHDTWAHVASMVPGRSASECRERWSSFVDPSVNTAPFTDEEDHTLLQVVHEKGPGRWSSMVHHLPGRTHIQVRNRWYAIADRAEVQTYLSSVRKRRRINVGSESTLTEDDFRVTVVAPNMNVYEM